MSKGNKLGPRGATQASRASVTDHSWSWKRTINCPHKRERKSFTKKLFVKEKKRVSWFSMAAAAKSLQSCPTLWDPTDGSPPGSPVPGILQARTLEWVAISFSNAWKWKVKGKSLGRVWLLVTPWTAAHQAPPSMGFSRQEYWSGVPLPSLVFNGGAGLKKTNKGPDVLWNWNNGAGRVTTPAPEGACGHSVSGALI